MSTVTDWMGWLNTLGDLSRVRILCLLDQHELGVGELSKALQLPQSTVSRHLKPLYDSGWIIKRSEGTTSLYRLNQTQLDTKARELWQLTRQQVGSSPVIEHDQSRLIEVLNERRYDSRTFFGRLGGEWDTVRKELFGDSFCGESLLHLLPQDLIVADLGCGTGNVAALLAPVVKRVIAVDRETSMLDTARRRLSTCDNIDFRKGTLEQLPLEDGEVDAAILMLVLHHLPEPILALKEARRALRPNGIVLIVDMAAHDRTEYQHTMGHQHLGFDPEQIRSLLDTAEFSAITHSKLRPHTAAKGPGLFACTALRR